jgi:hypothetical protein
MLSNPWEPTQEGRVSFRYYLYISDSKVDMLLPQIDPAFTRKRTSEVNLSLKIFGAKRGSESSVGTDRIVRLERVVRHLQDHGDLGSIDEPGSFFWGLLSLQWGTFAGEAGSSLVYFGGRTKRTIVGLGGSSTHVLGAALDPPGHPVLARSLMPSLLEGLTTDPEIKILLDAANGEPELADRKALQAVHLATASLRGPAQRVEFVAKRLLHGPSPSHDGMSVLLGSPLYVAVMD